MKRILFVDDESALLENLRRRLYRARSKWQMSFVVNAALALEELRSSPYDAVVTDMRMTNMDGAQLLEQAREISPETVRIVLSGYSEEGQVMRLVPLAHQYVAKPCDADKLEQLIDRCLGLRDLLTQPRIRAAVGRVSQLPVLPRVYARLCATMVRQDVSSAEVAEIIGSDTAVTAKVMQVVNSGFFRLARPINRIDQAVAHLGFVAIRSLALSAEVFYAWPKAHALAPWLEPERLQQHANRVAAGAYALARGEPWAQDALLAGLLHDIGYSVLLQQCPDELGRALALAEQSGTALVDAERTILDATHAEVGAYLLGLWGLPYGVIEAVASHHSHSSAGGGFGPGACVALAETLLAPSQPHEEAQRYSADALDDRFLAALGAPFGLTEAQHRLRELAKEEEGSHE